MRSVEAMPPGGWSVTFFVDTPWPEGINPPNPEIDGAQWRRVGTLPFVPVAGMMLGCSGGDDYRKVEQVFYSCDEPGHLTVQFEDDEVARPHTYMRSLGWEMEGGWPQAGAAVKGEMAGEAGAR